MALKNYIILAVIIISLVAAYFYFIDINVQVASPTSDLSISSPSDLEEVSGFINVRGVSRTDNDIYYRIDLGEWNLIQKEENWEFKIDTGILEKGQHVIYVKSGEISKAVRIIVI